MHGSWGHRAAAALLLGTLVSACSSSATLTTRDGHRFQGRVLGRDDAGHVWLQQEDGRRGAVKREDVVDVTHPGTGEIVAGAVLLGLIGVVAISDYSREHDCKSKGENGYGAAFCGPGFATFGAALAFGPPGLILGTDGLLTYFGSRSRYDQTLPSSE